MSSIYIPSRRSGDGALDTDYLRANYTTKPEFRSAIQSLEETNSHHEDSILALESQISSAGLKVWDNATTYAKDQLVIDGVGPSAKFYRSLIDGNIGNDPATEDTAWTLQAGDFRSPLGGDLTGFTDSSVVASVGGAAAADIAVVTTAIKAGTLDHDTAVTIGESTPVINIGTGANPKTINLGGAGDTVAIAGTLATIDTTNLQVTDSLIRVNKGGTAGSGGDAGLEIEEGGAVTAYIKTNASRNGFVLKAPVGSELAVNQSVATSSSPSFQSLSASAGVTAPSVISNTGQVILEQTGDQYGATRLQLRNRTGINGAQLICSADSGVCDMDFISGTKGIKTRFETRTSGGTADRVVSSENVNGEFIVHQSFNHIFAMGVNRVTSIKPFTAKAGVTVEGNLNVTGNITGLNLVQSTQTLTGSWNGGASPMTANIKATRFGPMVTLTFSGFDGPLTSSTILLTYSQSLPATYRPPAGGFRSMIQFDNGPDIRFVNLHVQDTGGFVIHSPNLTWNTANNAVLLNGTTVTYMV